MKKTTAFQLSGILVLVLVAIALAMPRGKTRPGVDPSPSPRHVDLVIALDTSSSMDGLIDSARQKLWDVVDRKSVV